MDTITTTNVTDVALLDGLANEARLYSESIATNMIQLGRVYTQAKRLVKHGEWTNWIRQNSGMSERSAQQLMQIYARFGNVPAFEGVEKSKLFKLLSLPAGEEEQFVESHDIAQMSSREIDKAVKELRERAENAESAVLELQNKQSDEATVMLQEKEKMIADQRKEIERLATIGKESMQEARTLRNETQQLRREIADNAEILEETQEEYNRLQNEMLNAQSFIARGDSEQTTGDTLTSEMFASAVKQFIGVCARMPHMGRCFSAMKNDDRNSFEELLETMEDWAKNTRKAMDVVSCESMEVE